MVVTVKKQEREVYGVEVRCGVVSVELRQKAPEKFGKKLMQSKSESKMLIEVSARLLGTCIKV